MILKDIFENVNNWLKFAEAKNGAIIAVNSALIFGISRIFLVNDIQNIFVKLYLFIFIFLLLVSTVIALLSFVPKLDYPYLFFSKKSKNDNLLYFGDIAKYAEAEYNKKIKKIVSKSENIELEKFYINQIVINSKITYIKYKQFEIAIWFTISAFLTPIGAILIYYIQKNR